MYGNGYSMAIEKYFLNNYMLKIANKWPHLACPDKGNSYRNLPIKGTPPNKGAPLVQQFGWKIDSFVL